MAGCVEYQSSKRGKILPIMCFSPMTEPENLDAWEPMKLLPENLLIICIERKVDARILKALWRAEAVVGEVCHEGTRTGMGINFELPLADVYRQMGSAEIRAYAFTRMGVDDASFFFIRGGEAVRAFDRELRKLTH